MYVYTAFNRLATVCHSLPHIIIRSLLIYHLCTYLSSVIIALKESVFHKHTANKVPPPLYQFAQNDKRLLHVLRRGVRIHRRTHGHGPLPLHRLPEMVRGRLHLQHSDPPRKFQSHQRLPQKLQHQRRFRQDERPLVLRWHVLSPPPPLFPPPFAPQRGRRQQQQEELWAD